MVPLGGMESGAGEFVATCDLGEGRDVQRTGPGDQELRDVFTPVGGEHVPAAFVVVPVAAIDERIELDVAAQAVLVGDPFEVAQDFVPVGKQVFPVRLGLEREGVQVRRDVARAAGVGVVAPGAADVVGFLQYDEVHSLLLQCDGHAQTGESGSDDDGAGTYRRLVGRAWRGRLGSRIGNAHNGSVFLFSGEFGASVTLAGANTQYPGYRI
ncbi:Uncharacterised protein [Mycobacterium tuberculosis]|uniref:Uncharacterized protein n=2 Tax=Mycobacterium tuberculosis TaxID=1773 RepID=A0A655IJU9_MYCTX|nr:Uncharacterised protein [Mycobacterium tuberculosis]CFE68936.1 Uncharacterised protein [Mycobacterium tuberculosis]CFR71047.1 Uncharacterised protein [Mycobacterium tuberculosis]CFS59784.1 Uncharacterised protein [Mycobacterium tuberculosis]CKQ83963.1 Uncharacterised protein [Mycobacterium tuberculosis]